MPSDPASNKALIVQFYEAFQRHDADAMSACYHAEVVFSDPAFGELHGKEVGAMWAMLLERAKGDLDITFSDVTADGESGSAHWEAKYRFGETGRPVHNKVDAEFRFEDGLIIEHRDSFAMREWLGMALGAYAGAPGLNKVFGTVVRNRVRSALSDYMDGDDETR